MLFAAPAAIWDADMGWAEACPGYALRVAVGMQKHCNGGGADDAIAQPAKHI